MSPEKLIMKHNKKDIFLKFTIMFSIIISTAIFLFACGEVNENNLPIGTENNVPVETSDDSVPEEIITDPTLDSFLDRIKTQNYVVNYKNDLKTNVCSDDLVYYNNTITVNGVSYEGIAVMTVNGNETFIGYLGENGLENISFLKEGIAIEVAGDGRSITDFKSRLLDYLIESSGGNLTVLFEKDEEEPLTYVSSDNHVKSLVQAFADVGDHDMRRMQDVFLIFDDEGVESAHLKTTFTEGYPKLKDIDISITFGNAASDRRVKKWMNDSARKYPAPRDSWGEDVQYLDELFLRDYGEIAFPFPDFATYAFSIETDDVLNNNEFRVRDCKATAKDMTDYIAELKNKGFEEVKNNNGEIYYRQLLRNEYKCYSMVHLEYDNGVNISARKYYDLPTYSGIDQVNAQLSAHGFTVLDRNDNFTGYSAVEKKYELAESWMYFFSYDTDLYVDIGYNDKEAAEKYINEYILSLDGFTKNDNSIEDSTGEYNVISDFIGYNNDTRLIFSLLKDDDVIYKQFNPDGLRSFKYSFNEDDKTLTLVFKNEKYVSSEKLLKELIRHGFPVINLDAYYSSRDLRDFKKTLYGYDYPVDYSLSLVFDESDDAFSFIDEFVKYIKEKQSFKFMNPELSEMNKSDIYSKELSDKVLQIGFNYRYGSKNISIEFMIKEK